MQTSSFGRQEMTNPGMVGAGVTAVTGVLGWIAAATPVLAALSLLISVIVGVLTSVWWSIKLYDRLFKKKDE